MSPSPNYFTCTLGEALTTNPTLKTQQRQNPFETVLDLIQSRAITRPDVLALGFASSGGAKRGKKKNLVIEPCLVTFGELDEYARGAASKLRGHIYNSSRPEKEERGEGGKSAVVVGLFCSSSLDLVLSWLGLTYLGHVAFFFAPQLHNKAIEHLCKETGIDMILVDRGHKEQISQIRGGVRVLDIPDYYDASCKCSTAERKTGEKKTSSDAVFFQHTSGTTSGLPKPIRQTQWGAVGCLPVFTATNPKGTFTTTPLYHGGIADALRAWTSGALIWFFPEDVMPVTSRNIQDAVHFARGNSREIPITYFSSVPYILQILAEEDDGVELLKSMDLIGVGGAPLTPIIGDHLVDSGVKLLSRMGSAECGFLMSSHRDYAHDKEWQYLRISCTPDLLDFEPRGKDVSELVVKRDWPLRLKTNRPDGSYATADLFESHPLIPNGWRYRGRADALITLSNGKKFDPSPVEDELGASCTVLRGVLIFGEGREFPGALLFIEPRDLSDGEVLEIVWPVIRRLNSAAPAYTRLQRSMLFIHRVKDGEQPLPKSSKGTVLRYQAEKMFSDSIEEAYARSQVTRGGQHVPDDQIVAYITDVFDDVFGRAIDPDQDVYAQGVDSIACMHISAALKTSLLPPEVKLPRNIIYDAGTITSLARNLKTIRNGGVLERREQISTDPTSSMRLLAEKYRPCLCSGPDRLWNRRIMVVVLTGATGALGAHILTQLMDNPEISMVYCLARGDTREQVKQRIASSLVERHLRKGKELQHNPLFHDRVVCLPSDLSSDTLGLSAEDLSQITETASHIIHAAWPVNFALSLASFEPQIKGVKNLIDIFSPNQTEVVFVSSTAAVSNTPLGVVPEKVIPNPQYASPLGYSRSKWVAEQVCAAAHREAVSRCPTSTYQKPRVSIIRVGQLCGNKFGIWNINEAYPQMLSTAKLTGCLPDLPGEHLNWLPVDIAAESILEIALSSNKSSFPGLKPDEVPVYHVLNHHMSPSWRQMLQWISEGQGSLGPEVVSVQTWMGHLERIIAAEPTSCHPWQALTSLWEQRYESDRLLTSLTTFQTTRTRQVSRSIRNLEPLNREHVMRMWGWIQNREQENSV
ncbi:acetyl-CoA synthetase-like protein [Poronia punctata]|nr:acetyl-CoA synthetase-like protein [Poronia punctata]